MKPYNYRAGALNAEIAASLDRLDASANTETARGVMDGCSADMTEADAVVMADWCDDAGQHAEAAAIRATLRRMAAQFSA